MADRTESQWVPYFNVFWFLWSVAFLPAVSLLPHSPLHYDEKQRLTKCQYDISLHILVFVTKIDQRINYKFA